MMKLKIPLRIKPVRIPKEVYPIIGFVLLYSFFELFKGDNSVNLSELKYLQGELVGEIQKGSHGGETEHNYYELHMKGINKPFRFNDCAYQQLIVTNILKGGIKLRIGFLQERNEYYNSVFLFDLNQNIELLELSSVNNCLNKKENLVRYVLIALIAVSIIRVYYFTNNKVRK